MGLGQHLKLMLVRAERDALVAELEARNAEIEQLRVQSDEWRDVAARVISVLQLNKIQVNGEYYAKCLNEIRAEAGRAGFVSGTEQCADYLDTYYADIDFSKYADQYAERVKRGEQ